MDARSYRAEGFNYSRGSLLVPICPLSFVLDLSYILAPPSRLLLLVFISILDGFLRWLVILGCLFV